VGGAGVGVVATAEEANQASAERVHAGRGNDSPSVGGGDGRQGDGRPDGRHSTLGPTEWPGLWATNDTGELRFNQGGLLVVDTGNLPAGDGFGFWRWLGRARDSDDANERLVDLLADNQLPINDRILFLEPIVERAFAVSDIERETASQRLRREGREEGRERGREEGGEEGREECREEARDEGSRALLAVAARFTPEALPMLRTIEDLDALRRAVDEGLSRKMGS